MTADLKRPLGETQEQASGGGAGRGWAGRGAAGTAQLLSQRALPAGSQPHKAVTERWLLHWSPISHRQRQPVCIPLHCPQWPSEAGAGGRAAHAPGAGLLPRRAHRQVQLGHGAFGKGMGRAAWGPIAHSAKSACMALNCSEPCSSGASNPATPQLALPACPAAQLADARHQRRAAQARQHRAGAGGLPSSAVPRRAHQRSGQLCGHRGRGSGGEGSGLAAGGAGRGACASGMPAQQRCTASNPGCNSASVAGLAWPACWSRCACCCAV